MRFLSAAEAALLVEDAATVAISGNGAGMVSPESILAALERRFLETGHPRDLTLVHSLGLGDLDALGTNRLAHEGLLRRVIAAHFTWSPRMQKLVAESIRSRSRPTTAAAGCSRRCARSSRRAASTRGTSASPASWSTPWWRTRASSSSAASATTRRPRVGALRPMPAESFA